MHSVCVLCIAGLTTGYIFAGYSQHWCEEEYLPLDLYHSSVFLYWWNPFSRHTAIQVVVTDACSPLSAQVKVDSLPSRVCNNTSDKTAESESGVDGQH